VTNFGNSLGAFNSFLNDARLTSRRAIARASSSTCPG
jgi:hypothetical protein